MSAIALKDNINTLRFNPGGIQRAVFDLLDQANEGAFDIVDPSNPFVFLLESNSVLTAAHFEESENIARRLYPSMAINEQELYLHMSDKDYLDRFASASRTVFTLLINKEEFIRRAVQTPQPHIKKITIPRNTEFKVADTTFTMEYPIDIRYMHHGNIQVVYDVTKPSPLQTLESNVVDWSIVKLNNEDFIQLKIPVYQWLVKSYFAHINRSVSYIKTFSFDNEYCFARIYRAKDGDWEEIRTTHTDQVFDPYNPTAVLTHVNGSLQVYIPQIYIANGTLDRELRVDIYTTKGPLEMMLDSYDVNAFSAKWRDLSGNDSAYSAPLNVFTTMAIYSDALVTGGKSALTFDELRERVIKNALGNMQLPITEAQLEARLSNLGYKAVKDIDNITNRVYLATRRLPFANTSLTSESAGSLVSIVQSSFAKLEQYNGVISHGEQDRITITPSAMFLLENGVMNFLTTSQIDALVGKPIDALLTELNTKQYFFNPFYTVLDAQERYFHSRAYDLDYPKVSAREFLEENSTIAFNVSTRDLSVFKKDWGYLIQCIAVLSKSAQELPHESIRLQLSINPIGEHRDVYINATLKRVLDSGERVFTARLESDFDIDEKHGLRITNAQMYQNEIKAFPISLESNVEMNYLIDQSVCSSVARELNTKIGDFLIDTPSYILTREQATITFGVYLEHFWKQYRTIINSYEYLTYPEDIEKVYDNTIYATDPVTGTVSLSLDASGNLQYTILQRAGDPVIDASGNPVLEHRRGETVLDENGNPVIANPRDLLREWGAFFIDARYKFSTSPDDVSYLQTINSQIRRWIDEDMSRFADWTLEQTNIYLYPLKTTGYGEALIGDEQSLIIPLEQSITVRFYVDSIVYSNNFIRQSLEKIAKDCVVEILSSREIHRNKLVSLLTDKAGDNVIAIDVEGLGGSLNLTTLSLLDSTTRCSLGKTLTRRVDGTLAMVDDLSVEFLQYQTTA